MQNILSLALNQKNEIFLEKCPKTSQELRMLFSITLNWNHYEMNVVVVVLNWQKCCKFSQDATSPKCHDIQIVRTEGSKNTKFICWFLQIMGSLQTSEKPYDVFFLAMHPYKSTRHHRNQRHNPCCTWPCHQNMTSLMLPYATVGLAR